MEHAVDAIAQWNGVTMGVVIIATMLIASGFFVLTAGYFLSVLGRRGRGGPPPKFEPFALGRTISDPSIPYSHPAVQALLDRATITGQRYGRMYVHKPADELREWVKHWRQGKVSTEQLRGEIITILRAHPELADAKIEPGIAKLYREALSDRLKITTPDVNWCDCASGKCAMMAGADLTNGGYPIICFEAAKIAASHD